MSLNKTLALLIVGLFLVEVMPATPVQAQGTSVATGFDLEVVGLTIVDPASANPQPGGDQPRTGIPTTIQFDLINHGPKREQGTNGFQIFIGWNGTADSNCIEPTKNTGQSVGGQPVQTGTVGGTTNAGAECYKTVGPNDDAANLDVNHTAHFVVQWTPIQNSDGFIEVQIENTAPVSNGAPPSDGTATTGQPNVPDVGHAQNDITTKRVTVGYAQVRAKPVRDAAPSWTTPQAKPNNPWKYDELQKAPPCVDSTATATRSGCIGRPDTHVTFEYDVVNEGNVPDTYVASIANDISTLRAKQDVRDTDGGKNVTQRGYRFDLPPPLTLLPGEHRVVRLTIGIPASELVNYYLNGDNQTDTTRLTKLRFTSRDVNPAVSTDNTKDPSLCPTGSAAANSGFCGDPTLPSILIGPRFRFNFSSRELAEPVFANFERTFNITVNNTGNAWDTFNLTFDRDHHTTNDSWSPQVKIPEVSIAPGAQANVSVSVSPPANATIGRYSFDVRVLSKGDPAGANSNITFYADMQQTWGKTLGVLPTSTVESVAASQTAKFILNVSNFGGNGPDNATIDVVNQRPGWTYDISETQLHLPAFGYELVSVNLTPPAGELANLDGYLYFNLTSEGPKDRGIDQRQKVPLYVHATVRNAPNIETTTPVSSAFIDAGKTGTFPVTIRNTGNLASEFDAALTRGDIAWVASVEPDKIVLGPLESGVFNVSLRAPGTADVGDTTKAFLHITPVADSGAAQTVTLEGRASGPDLTLTQMLLNQSAIYSNDQIGIDLVLANAGNRAPVGNVTLRLYWAQGGAEKVIGEVTYNGSELPGNRRVTQRFTWDTTGYDGDGALIARVDPENTIKEIDDSAASNEISKPVSVRILDIAIGRFDGLSGHPGESISYAEPPHALSITYRGNEPTEDVQIIVESEHGWIPGDTTQVRTLPRLTPVVVPLDLLIPTDPGVASDRLRVSVIPTLRPDTVLTASTLTTVLDDAKPTILGASVSPENPALGQNVTLTVRLHDATGISQALALLVTPTNDTQTVPLTAAGDDRWIATQPYSSAGTWRVLVQAADGADPPNLNKTLSPILSFIVTPGSAPTIQLATGQSALVRTGAFVKVDITDPLGIASASYSVRGVSYQMTRPYVIDTTSFTQGVIDVSVTATNLYGATTTSKLTLTVKNTPPGISSVEISPASPKAGQDVTVHVKADPDTSSVQVLIKKGGQVVDTRTASRGPSGSYDVTFNPVEGDYSLDVSAKDGAGNTKLDEGAVVFSARASNALPAPGVGLVALAVVGVALLLSRKKR